MNKYALLYLLLLPTILLAYGSIPFDQYFVDKTMRIDYFHIGDAKEDIITIDQIYEQGVWAARAPPGLGRRTGRDHRGDLA